MLYHRKDRLIVLKNAFFKCFIPFNRYTDVVVRGGGVDPPKVPEAPHHTCNVRVTP